MSAPLDRWGRKPDLRGLYPDLTEDEALAMRASHEGDDSYVAHLSREQLAAAFQGLADKGYVDHDVWNADTGEWERVQSSAL